MQGGRPSYYQRLADYLARRSEREVLLTFAEVEAIIGTSLPLAAIYNMTWWTDPSAMPVRLWRERGWRAYPNRALRHVRFIRDAEE